ncbi:MAG: hypothetical protein U0W24_04600 [Bacteroidales bacterium]
MKPFVFIIMFVGLIGCKPRNDNSQNLQNRIDSLERKIAEAYKPGFGEFMSNIQVHHNKLWFAGLNQNWKLAGFEVHEMIEAIDDIQKYQSERKESLLTGMIMPELDSISAAVEQKNLSKFKKNYFTLTNTCNKCHQDVGFEFNVVKIPDNPPFSNQDFKHQKDE